MDEPLQFFDSRPSRADAVKNRSLLLQTARQLFAEQGIEAVSMTAIADRAGVGKGTLYRHFENKLELCLALLDEEQRALQQATLERLRLGGDPLDHLRQFLMDIAAFVGRNADLLDVSAGEGSMGSLTHPAHLWWRQTIRGLLAQITPHQDIDYLSDVLYIMLDARSILFQQQTQGYDAQRLSNGLMSLLLKLIA
jgi:AcrR family transcriptional regulator